MQITLKQYKRIQFVITFLLAFFISQFIVFKNYLAPIFLVAIASLILLYIRKQVKEVIADERDYQIGGKSAMLAMQIFSWVSVVVMFAFYAFSARNPAFETIAITLAFSVCALMLIYSFIFRYFIKAK